MGIVHLYSSPKSQSFGTWFYFLYQRQVNVRYSTPFNPFVELLSQPRLAWLETTVEIITINLEECHTPMSATSRIC